MILKLGFLASGNGSSAEAIVRAIESGALRTALASTAHDELLTPDQLRTEPRESAGATPASGFCVGGMARGRCVCAWIILNMIIDGNLRF